MVYYTQADSTTTRANPTNHVLPFPQTHLQVDNSYYVAFDPFTRLGVTHETAVRAASQSIL